MSNKPTGLYTWEQILEATGKANVSYGAWVPQQWIDCLNEALREAPSRPEPLRVTEVEQDGNEVLTHLSDGRCAVNPLPEKGNA